MYETKIVDWDGGQMLQIWHNGEIVDEQFDGGEAEDNYFSRDWKWVPDALQKAYEYGKADALKEK